MIPRSLITNLARLGLSHSVEQRLINRISPVSCIANRNYNFFDSSSNYNQIRYYAARKGTRAKKEAKKVKKVEVKKVFMFKKYRKDESLEYKKQRPFDDSSRPIPVDNVFIHGKFVDLGRPFVQAVECHRESHHPTVYNFPNVPLIMRIDIDLRYPNRPNKCMDGWKSIIEMKMPFLLEGMIKPTVMAICPDDTEMIAEVIKAGADLAGSKEIIRQIEDGQINPQEYEHVVAHPSMITELTSIRGLIKKQFPNLKNKTLHQEVAEQVIRLKSGIRVSLNRTDREPDYGYIEIPIGRDTVPRRVKGKTPKEFVLQCILRTDHSFETIKVNVDSYLKKIEQQEPKRGQPKVEIEEPEEPEEAEEEKTATG